ncbi:PD-(D/E)XK nuclease family protein [Pedobacter sp. JCM 36344]|uniref:PD-(D/E)XK nuclease family protein n=1 Tax=Pedobacter sp. JCM 36344 TaxID=3374280 RepID=UPI00397CB7A3
MVGLELEYSELLNKEFAKQAKREKNFLDIAGMPHYENVNSNLLKFFFDSTEEHGFSDLFLTSLLELIPDKKNVSLIDWKIEREVKTKNNKRIDLAILSLDKDQVIIIENKIYHLLNNDLNDYWNHYEEIADNRKIGIVLSLYSLTIKNDKFTNVTHQQLCTKVLQNLGRYLLIANQKYIVYLKDYIENINTFYMTDTQKKKLEFYFNHSDKINELAQIKDYAASYLANQVNIVAEKLDFNIGSKNSQERRSFYFKNVQGTILYYAIFFKNWLTSQATFRIILEGHGISDDVQQHVIDTIKDKYQNLSHHTSPMPYIHFLKKDYKFNPEYTLNFSNVIINILEKDFDAARKEVTQLLNEKIS